MLSSRYVKHGFLVCEIFVGYDGSLVNETEKKSLAMATATAAATATAGGQVLVPVGADLVFQSDLRRCRTRWVVA